MNQDDQTNNDLAKKKQEAAKAMSLGFKATAQTNNTIPKVATPPERNSMATAELRLRAQIAMEGEERRKKREEAARLEREEKERIRLENERKQREAYEQERLKKEQEAQQIREQEERERVAKQLKQQVDTIRESGAGLKTIRTLKADTDSLIKSQNISLVGIAIKEEERRRQNQENQTVSSSKNLTIALASFVLIALGLGITLYIYKTFYSGPTTNIISGQNNLPESIIFAQKNKILDITNITADELVDRLKNEVRNPPDLLIGQIENLQFTKTLADGKQLPINTNELLAIIGGGAPDSLIRALDQQFMFGVLSSAENAGFIIVKTESHEKGLAGLLDWESGSMTENLYQILTSMRPDKDLLTKPYEDMVVRNIDTRALKDSEGTVRLIYGFLDGDKTIIIAGNQQAFIEALRRFNTPKPTKQ